jgi:hypothetical protein
MSQFWKISQPSIKSQLLKMSQLLNISRPLNTSQFLKKSHLPKAGHARGNGQKSNRTVQVRKPRCQPAKTRRAPTDPAELRGGMSLRIKFKE